MPRKTATYGWKPDLPDHRDHYCSLAVRPASLPSSVDLRPQCPGVYDQGQLGSCTANAIAGAFEFEQMKQNIAAFVPSRLFIYYNERVIEGDVSQDNGAQIRDGMRSVNTQGVCPELMWTYNVDRFAELPSSTCYSTALQNKLISYAHIPQNVSMMKACLAGGAPFVFGFTVYDGFESQQVANTGTLNLPGPNEQQVGGHAIMCVGYNDATQRFIIRNSWGSDWGMKGYFTMPYDYATNSDLANDFWTIKLVD